MDVGEIVGIGFCDPVILVWWYWGIAWVDA